MKIEELPYLPGIPNPESGDVGRFTSCDNGEHCSIEAYDGEKMTVVLTGPNVDEVVRTRTPGLRTGAMLWIDNNRFRYYGTDADGRRMCLYPVGCDEVLPPSRKTDRRIAFIYAVLRRIWRSALGTGVSQDMFTLGVALSLMMTFRMVFWYNRFYAAANGMLKAAKEIVERL